MKPTRSFRFALLGLSLSCVANAPADEASHRQEVEKLFNLTRMEQKVGESVDNLVALQLQQNPQLTQHRGIVHDFFERYIGWQALHPALTDMYLSSFSEQELQQINGFYITPVGQKVLTRVPELVQERNRVALQRLKEHIGELQKELDTTQGQ